jgi:hypothetical protein
MFRSGTSVGPLQYGRNLSHAVGGGRHEGEDSMIGSNQVISLLAYRSGLFPASLIALDQQPETLAGTRDRLAPEAGIYYPYVARWLREANQRCMLGTCRAGLLPPSPFGLRLTSRFALPAEAPQRTPQTPGAPVNATGHT